MPIDAYPAGVSPCGAFNMFGNVDEWTATKDGMGGHFVQLGITRQAPAGHPGDDVGRIYVGFRCAASATSISGEPPNDQD